VTASVTHQTTNTITPYYIPPFFVNPFFYLRGSSCNKKNIKHLYYLLSKEKGKNRGILHWNRPKGLIRDCENARMRNARMFIDKSTPFSSRRRAGDEVPPAMKGG